MKIFKSKKILEFIMAVYVILLNKAIDNITEISYFVYGYLISNPKAGQVAIGFIVIFSMLIIFKKLHNWQNSVLAETESK